MKKLKSLFLGFNLLFRKYPTVLFLLKVDFLFSLSIEIFTICLILQTVFIPAILFLHYFFRAPFISCLISFLIWESGGLLISIFTAPFSLLIEMGEGEFKFFKQKQEIE